MKPGHLLELGCASGSYLEYMHRAGWSVEGIEFSDTAAARARSKGFSVQTSSVEDASVAAASVDLVAAWMVLEHLHDPVGSLEKIRRWIKPDGYLALSIPLHSGSFLRLFGSASYDLHLPNHLYHFSRKTIGALMRRAGWEIENVFWQRNANTVLWTLEYAANDRGWSRVTAGVRWLRTSKSVPRLRMFIGWFLGVIRASGRVEIWARPRNGAQDVHAAARNS
jgi:SAM-dependent methyltransferase